MRRDHLKAEQTKNETAIDNDNWNSVFKPKLKRVKRTCEQLDLWLEMKEDNGPEYETMGLEFEMLQLEKEYLQDKVGDCNKIINNQAKISKNSRRDRRLTSLKGNLQEIQ